MQISLSFKRTTTAGCINSVLVVHDYCISCVLTSLIHILQVFGRAENFNDIFGRCVA